MQTAKDGFGYLEDRRPSANMDPYQVCYFLMQTTCSKENSESFKKKDELEAA